MTSDLATTESRPRWIVALRALLILLACLLAGGAIYVRNAMKPRATPPPPLPRPNGYDDLIRAAGLIRGEAPNGGKIRGAKVEDLKAWVAANAEALQVAREGLARPSRVPVDYDQDLRAEFDHVGGCRSLARLLSAEGEIAAGEGRPDDAARAFLDGVRLGRAAGRGGLMIDVLAGVAIETQALDSLVRLRENLSADSARRAIAALLESDKERPTFAEVLNDDTYWFERTSPYWNRLMLRVSGVGAALREPADKAARQAMDRATIALRREVFGLAEHLYFLDKKADPASPDDLVPAYLPAIPVHPNTGRLINEIESSGPK